MDNGKEVKVRFSALDCTSKKRLTLLAWNSETGSTGPSIAPPRYAHMLLGASAKKPHYVIARKNLITGTSTVRMGDLRNTSLSIKKQYTPISGAADFLGAVVFVNKVPALVLLGPKETKIDLPKLDKKIIKSLRVMTFDKTLTPVLSFDTLPFLP